MISMTRLNTLIGRHSKFMKRLVGFYMPSKHAFVDLPWDEKYLLQAKVGFHLFRRMMNDKPGRSYLTHPECQFHMLGIAFVENAENIFQSKKHFMQDVTDLFENEVKYLDDLKKKKANRRTIMRESVQIEDINRESMQSSQPGFANAQ